MDVVRITELQPKTYVEQGDYIAIDNQSDGTKKVQFTNLLDDTLSQENKIAPANVVGDEIATIRAAVGSPLKASTVAQMTDTNKIYVYVGSESGYTNGNWYYWNGSAWVSGGVYNSVAVVTDPTLTLSGVPADAKATGDEVTNLKADLSGVYTGIYSIRNDGYITANSVGAVVDYTTPTASTSYKYVVVTNVPKGARFLITSTGGNAAKPWAWLKANGTVISFSSANSANGYTTIAPEDDAVLVCNFNTSYTRSIERLFALNDIEKESSTLKVDDDAVEYRGEYAFKNVGYITANSVGASVDCEADIVPSASFRVIVITNIKAGTKFIVTSTGGASAKPWSWLKSNGTVISYSSSNSASAVEITAPEDNCILVCNFNNTQTKSLKRVLSTQTIKDTLDAIPFLDGTEQRSFEEMDFIQGNLNTSTGAFTSSTTRLTSASVPIKESSKVTVTASSGYKFRCCYFDKEQTFIYTDEQTGWSTGTVEFPTPTGATFVRICVALSGDGTILPSATTGAKVIITVGFRMVDNWNLKGKKLSILGDSLSTYGGSISDPSNARYSQEGNPYTYVGNRCRYPQSNLLISVYETYWMKLIKHFGFVLGINESWAGTCVAWDGESSGAYAPQNCISSQTRIDHLDDNGTPDIILVNGGTNDIGQGRTIGTFNTESPINYTDEEIAALNVTTFANAYRAMLIRLQKTYPKAIVIAILPNYASAYYTPADADAYNEIIKEACDYFGVLWIDARTSGVTMFNRDTYLPDGLHYNSAGMEMLFNNIKNAIERNYA